MSKFKYPYYCTECGHRFDSTGNPTNCHSCHTDNCVIDLNEWEKGHKKAAEEFIRTAKLTGVIHIVGRIEVT